MRGPDDGEESLARRAFVSFLEILALTGFAVAQPVLDVFGRAPDRFLLRDASRLDIVAFAVAVALVPAIVLWVVEWLVWAAGERARRVAHAVIVGLLVAILVFQVLRRAGTLSGAALVLVAVAVGALAVFAYHRWRSVRTWLAVASGATVLYLAVFLLMSPTADLLSGDEVTIADTGPIERPRPIVVLQFDEWPLASIMDGSGHIDASLYPHLAALASDGTWYRNATTVATYTSYAVPAVVTGRYPRNEAIPTASAYPESLFTALGGTYDLEVQETVTRLCPTVLCARSSATDDSGLGPLLSDARRAFGVMVSPDPDREFNAGAAAAADAVNGLDGVIELRPESVTRLLGSINQDEAPTLHYLHLLLPHIPYRFLPSGQAYEAPAATIGPNDPLGGEIVRSTDPVAVTITQQRLILQARYADRVVGEVTDRLKETGLYDDAVVVVVADHGVGLVPGESTRVMPEGSAGEPLYPDLLYVPMILKGPGLAAGEVSDANAQTIDVLPTVADLIGLELPWEVDGIALSSEQRSSAEKGFHIVTEATAVGGASSLGPRVSFDGDDFGPQVAAHNVDTVLQGDNPAYRNYDISPAGELVGRGVGEVTIGTPSPWTVTRRFPELLDAYDPTSGVLPARLNATLAGPDLDQRPTIAVALNGRIAAVVETHALGVDAQGIEAMLVPELIVPGANDVTFYVVEGPEGARTLHQLTVG